MVEAAFSTQSTVDGEQSAVEKKRQQLADNEGAASSTQPDNKEIIEMLKKAFSTQSTVDGEQSAVVKKEKKRQQLVEYELQRSKEFTQNEASDRRVDLARYQPLLRAAHDKNMKAVEDFVNKNLETILDARIDETGSTIFHLIVKFPATEALTEKLLSKVHANSLVERTNMYRSTALHVAAAVGNTKAVKLLVKKNKDLLTIKNKAGLLPLSYAIVSGRYKDTVEYLLSDPEGRIENFAEKFPRDSADVLFQLIEANHIDLAFGFLNQNPNLADRHRNPELWKKTLYSLAGKDTELPSGGRIGFLQSIIYHYIPVEKRILRSENGDIENQTQTSRKANIFGKLQYMLWNALMSLVPGIKRIHDQKLMHVQTLEIVRLMIAGVTWTYTEALESLKKPVLRAAKLGNYMFVEEFLRVYNQSILFYDKHGHTIIHRAVLHRQEKVFNLIYNQSFLLRDTLISLTDDNDCNILHLAGKLVPSSRVPGAVLQMQRELQWFRTVEDVFHPSIQEQRNSNRKKPREVFTEEHRKLVKEGERWMKETATSCSVVAALIITVVFATAYTFPGGINGEGVPNFFPKISFKVFLVSIALALFSSTASVQMFLGILTSRYAEEDFLESLPKKLIIGLVTLLFSIATMMLAFASTFHIFLHQPWKWVTLLMAVLAFIPVTLFALMQFPLLLDIYKFTYGRTFLRPMK